MRLRLVPVGLLLAAAALGCTPSERTSVEEGPRDRLAPAPQSYTGQPNFEVPSDAPSAAGIALPGPTAFARPSGPPCNSTGRTVGPEEEPDWSDFVHFGGQYYLLAEEGTAVALGEPVGRINCRLLGSGTPSDYQVRDGDAAYLDAGTKLYRVAGVPLQKVLAVRRGDQVDLYRPEPAG